MPNQTGGKNYKKSKHSSASMKPVMIDRQHDQLYARVIKVLGNCNLLVYCNDNKTRLAHIRGSLKKRARIVTGDIILISLRDFETYAVGEREKSDVVARYDPDLHSKLRKLPDINPKLFMVLEDTAKSTGVHMPPEEAGMDIDFEDTAQQEEGTEEASEEEESDVDVDNI